MTAALEFKTVAPEGYNRIIALHRYVAGCGLEPTLIDMVYLRVSQLNGCAYCIDLHYRDGLKSGVTPRQFNGLLAWREMPFYSARERAALAWAEALTDLPAADIAVARAAARQHFTDKELVDLTYAIGLMNALNRLGIGCALEPPAEVAA